jgi:hypothetical protein
MNTYYDIRLTPEQRRTLIKLANMGLIEWCSTWEAVPNDPRKTAYEQAVALLEDAEEHPNIEDVYQYEAEHTGFTEGEKVLVEGIVRTTAMSTRLSSQHLPVLINDYTQGAVEVNPHISTIYHKD